MKLKAIVPSLDDVPSQFQELYTEQDGQFVLTIDDTEYKSKVSEFRTNNIELARRLEEAETQTKTMGDLQKQLEAYNGLDPELAREALDLKQNLDDKQLMDAGKFEELLAQRTDRMRSEYEGQVTALTTRVDLLNKESSTYKKQLYDHVIENSLQKAVTSVAKVRPGAMQDILSRGRSVWGLDDGGTPVPKDDKGNVMYGKDGDKALTMEEWGQGLLQDASYLFEGSVGGGGQGSTEHSTQGGSMIKSSDQDSLNNNIAAIAAGTATVIE